MDKLGGRRLICAATMTLLALGRAHGADAVTETPMPVAEPATVVNEWIVTVAPYVWASGIEGSAGVFGLPPQDIDASFADIVENLEGSVMLATEARYGPWMVNLDLMYTRLGTAVGTPFGILADEVDITSKMFVATAVGGYSVFDDGTARIDLFGGARLWSSDTEFDFTGGALDGRSRSDSAIWVDPVVGVKARTDLGDSGFHLAGWAMIGGFGASSDIMWDVMGGAGYQFTDNASAFVGYRGLGVDYEDDGYVLDITQHGPMVGGVFRF